MNRISTAIARMEQQIDERLANGIVTKQQLKETHQKLDMSLSEYCLFQERKSCASGSALTLEEANTIYGYLGETPETFNRQPLHVKAVLTKVFAELY